ncbi:Macrocin-O-methyltransferase [Candidatus Magnetomorum sp. HK-1]|nr:Macrocin-O-methyltransferase [Candidatus Magnetomorum sp. HK-1]
MNWHSGQLKIDTSIQYPSDKQLQDKYFIGTSLLIKHKDKLLESGDPRYQTFISLYERITAHTMLDFDRAFILYQAVLSTQNLVGSTAECGVYKGGISLLIASLSPEKKHYALDTFEGMPDSISPIDSHKFGDLSTPYKHNINKLFKAQPNICMLKGKFNMTFNDIKDRIFSFVYVDADLYSSTLECCNFFYPRLASGGIMLFDDYLVDDTRGVKKAVDEYFKNKRSMPLVLPTSQAIVYQI